MLQMFQLHANVEKSNRSIAEKVKLNKRMAWMSKKNYNKSKTRANYYLRWGAKNIVNQVDNLLNNLMKNMIRFDKAFLFIGKLCL